MKELFKKISFIQLILDLIIVFIGVSLAFLFTNYQEKTKKEKETAQLLFLLNTGLNRYEKLFKGFISYHDDYNIHFNNQLESNEIPDIQGITFLSPAYPINAVSLLTDQGYDVLGSNIYIALISFSNAMQRLTYIEQKLVAISEKSMGLSQETFSTKTAYKQELKKWAAQYLIYLELRKSVLNELLDKSSQLKKLIDDKYPLITHETN